MTQDALLQSMQHLHLLGEIDHLTHKVATYLIPLSQPGYSLAYRFRWRESDCCCNSIAGTGAAIAIVHYLMHYTMVTHHLYRSAGINKNIITWSKRVIFKASMTYFYGNCSSVCWYSTRKKFHMNRRNISAATRLV